MLIIRWCIKLRYENTRLHFLFEKLLRFCIGEWGGSFVCFAAVRLFQETAIIWLKLILEFQGFEFVYIFFLQLIILASLTLVIIYREIGMRLGLVMTAALIRLDIWSLGSFWVGIVIIFFTWSLIPFFELLEVELRDILILRILTISVFLKLFAARLQYWRLGHGRLSRQWQSFYWE